jgi:hypothetical protein
MSSPSCNTQFPSNFIKKFIIHKIFKKNEQQINATIIDAITVLKILLLDIKLTNQILQRYFKLYK